MLDSFLNERESVVFVGLGLGSAIRFNQGPVCSGFFIAGPLTGAVETLACMFCLFLLISFKNNEKNSCILCCLLLEYLLDHNFQSI